jgi:hypothetical protein
MIGQLIDAQMALQEVARQVNASGDVAQRGTCVEICHKTATGVDYARKRIGRKVEGCGQKGSTRHHEAILSVQRREVLTKVERMVEEIRELLYSDALNAISPDRY